jgi:predicted TIM-barrel fold metal-dependent hydrolase
MPAKVIDVHGHIVAPSELYSYREFLIGTRGHYGRRLKGFSDAREGMSHGRTGVIPPEDLRHFAEEHISWLDKVGTDVQLVSARPYSLMHSEKPGRIVHWWAQAVNDAIATQVELARCVEELGFVGVLVNPDPSEGRGSMDVPGLGDEYWYPLYEKLVGYQVPMLIHSCGCVSLRENQSLHFINEESVAVMSLVQSDVFDIFPDLKVVVPHGGGAIPYQVGRFSGTYWAGTGKETSFTEAIRQLYYDTALYTPEALALLLAVVGPERALLGTERPGDGSHQRNASWADDIAAVVRSLPDLTDKDLDHVLGDTAIAIFPRLAAKLDRAGAAS